MMVSSSLHRRGASLLCVGLLSLGTLAARAGAQQQNGDKDQAVQDSFAQVDSFSRRHVVQLSPHVLRFDAQRTSAVLEFHNPTDSVKVAQVQVQFAFLDYAHGMPSDTIVIDPRDGERSSLAPHDTVILKPGAKDPFAGRWLSGVPTSVTLKPRETKRVTVKLTPPASLPPGEYWARIQTVAPNKPNKGGTQDVRQRYAMPTKMRVPLLRDTCFVLYRQGPLRMGLEIGSAATAEIDEKNVGGVDKQHFSHALWVRMPLHLTGNVPFRGMIHSEYRNVKTGEVVNPNRFEYQLFKDAVLHLVVETDVLSPGTWEYTISFDNEGDDIPQGERLPMTPVKKTFTFDVKPAWAY